MKKSNFVSLIFLGMYGSENDIYRYSGFYKDCEEINELLYIQLKEILQADIIRYMNASLIVKTNQKINDLVLDIDPRMDAYTYIA